MIDLVDLPLNRVVAAAHRKLRALPYADKTLASRLRALDPAFAHLAPPAGEPPRVIAMPRHYADVLGLARLVLSGRTVLPTGGGFAGVSVLFNMTKIWEQYVGRWVRARHRGRQVEEQHPIPIAPGMVGWADIVVFGRGGAEAVYDAKYSLWNNRPSRDDVYQMFTYAHLLGVDRATLVHPGAEDESAAITIGGLTIENRAIKIA